MMQKKLTATDIEQIYAFTSENGVAYYDLQSELADHLAHAIEEQWAYNQNLNVDDALQVAFKTFGKRGFKDIVDDRTATLKKRYEKLMNGYIVSFFTFPKIIFTLAFAYGVFRATEYSIKCYLALVLIQVAANLIIIIPARKRIKREAIQTGRKWMFKDMIYKFGGILGFIGLPLQVLQFGTSNHKFPSHIVIGLTFFYVLIAIYNYVVVIVIPSKANEHLKKMYPEYEMENIK